MAKISVPSIVKKTVQQARALPEFMPGKLKLATKPPAAPPTSMIANQDPPAGTMLDAGGTVTAIIQSQSSSAGT